MERILFRELLYILLTLSVPVSGSTGPETIEGGAVHLHAAHSAVSRGLVDTASVCCGSVHLHATLSAVISGLAATNSVQGGCTVNARAVLVADAGSEAAATATEAPGTKERLPAASRQPAPASRQPVSANGSAQAGNKGAAADGAKKLTVGQETAMGSSDAGIADRKGGFKNNSTTGIGKTTAGSGKEETAGKGSAPAGNARMPADANGAATGSKEVSSSSSGPHAEGKKTAAGSRAVKPDGQGLIADRHGAPAGNELSGGTYALASDRSAAERGLTADRQHTTAGRQHTPAGRQYTTVGTQKATAGSGRTTNGGRGLPAGSTGAVMYYVGATLPDQTRVEELLLAEERLAAMPEQARWRMVTNGVASVINQVHFLLILLFRLIRCSIVLIGPVANGHSWCGQRH